LDGEGGGVAADSAVGGVTAGGTVSWASSATWCCELVIASFATNAEGGAVANEAVGVAGDGTNSANTGLAEPRSRSATSADCCRCAAGDAW